MTTTKKPPEILTLRAGHNTLSEKPTARPLISIRLFKTRSQAGSIQ
jgi:hypothetical protein